MEPTAKDSNMYREAARAQYASRNMTFESLRRKYTGGEYRKLIEHYVRKVENMETALESVIKTFSAEEQAIIEILIDAYNMQMENRVFWHTECCEIFERICTDFAKAMSDRGLIAEEWLQLEAFNVVTLHIAWTASNDREFRKFAGIRKSIFFR